MGGSMSGGGGFGGGGGSSSGSRGAGGGGGGGWGGAKRGADGMTASQRAQTRDSRLGMKTGTTWHGNTAVGRPGKMASGFATMAKPTQGFGMGPSKQTFGNLKDLSGRPVMAGGGMAKPAMNKQPQPAGAPPPGQPLAPHPFSGLTKPMLPGLFGGGFAPYQYTSMGPWPGQSAIPNNPPVYRPAPGNKMFYDRVPQDGNKMSTSNRVNNIQSGDGWLNNGWGGYGWNKNGSGGGFGGGGGGGW
jgi:hypothetical protein